MAGSRKIEVRVFHSRDWERSRVPGAFRSNEARQRLARIPRFFHPPSEIETPRLFENAPSAGVWAGGTKPGEPGWGAVGDDRVMNPANPSLAAVVPRNVVIPDGVPRVEPG